MDFLKKIFKGLICVVVMIPIGLLGGFVGETVPFMQIDMSNYQIIFKNPWKFSAYFEFFLAFILPWILPIVAKYYPSKKKAAFISAWILCIAFVPFVVRQEIFLWTTYSHGLKMLPYSILFPTLWICLYGGLLILVARLLFRLLVPHNIRNN